MATIQLRIRESFRRWRTNVVLAALGGLPFLLAACEHSHIHGPH